MSHFIRKPERIADHRQKRAAAHFKAVKHTGSVMIMVVRVVVVTMVMAVVMVLFLLRWWWRRWWR